MKLRLSFLLPGTIALLLSSAALLPVVAQTSAPTRPNHERVNKLNLTDAQKARMKEIRESTRTQIEAVLTTAQKAQLEAARQAAKQSGQRPKNVWASLNLSAEQKAKIKAIHQESRRQMESVLSADQLQQLKQRHQMRRTTPSNSNSSNSSNSSN